MRIPSPNRALFPEAGFTKADLAAYFEAVAPALLLQLADRPVTRIRFPEGVGGRRFYERNTPRWAPAWLRHLQISASPGSETEYRSHPAKLVDYPFIDDVAGLRWMAGQAAIELHTPQYRVGPRGAIRRPDRLVIDLDPGRGAGLDECAWVAVRARERLAADGLVTWPVTSGGSGIHLYASVPGGSARLARAGTARSVHAYVRDLARKLARAHPDRIVDVADRDARAGRVFLDWSQNHPARSTATPYTLRGRGAAPTVAAPRRWAEIAPGLVQLGPAEVVARLSRDGDLLAAHGLAD